MRKSTLFVLAIFFAATVFGQYTQNQTMGTANTLVSVPANGGLRAALINRTFTDTTAANSHPIKTYPFAQIATTGDGNMWVRNYLATGWVLLGGGTSPSGTFWKVGGNMFPVSAPTRDIGTDATYGGAVGLVTNGVVRAIVPSGGFLLDNDTTSNKIFTWNPSTKDWGYANWNNGGGGGATPTLQQVLTAGSTLTSANDIILNSTVLRILNGGEEYLKLNPTLDNEEVELRVFNPTATNDARVVFSTTDLHSYGEFEADFGDGINVSRVDVQSSSGSSKVILSAFNDGGGLNGSYLHVGLDSIMFEPEKGIINIDSLRTWSAVADTTYKKPMTWDTRNGRWEYASNWFGGGGSTPSLQQVTDVGATTTNAVQVGTSLTVQGGNDPFLSMKQATSNQEYRFRVGVGTGLSSQSFSLYDATAAATRMVITTGGHLVLGRTDLPAAHSRLLVYGGLNGANIDALPDSTQNDESNMEVMGADYYGSSFQGYGVAMTYNGNANTGSVLGYSKKNFGQLRFTGVTNFVRVTTNASLRFATNNTEKAVLDSNGRFGINVISPSSLLHVNDSEDNTGYVAQFGKAGVLKAAIGTEGNIYMVDMSAPSTPSSGYGTIYVRTDSLRFKNDAGTEFTLGSGGGSPGGANKKIQYNSSGSFAGAGNMTREIGTTEYLQLEEQSFSYGNDPLLKIRASYGLIGLKLEGFASHTPVIQLTDAGGYDYRIGGLNDGSFNFFEMSSYSSRINLGVYGGTKRFSVQARADAPSGNSVEIFSGTAGSTGLVITGASGQTANLLEIKNSTPSNLAVITATGSFDLYNGTAPTSSVTNGIRLYSEDVTASAELKVRDEAGNITTLSPHNFGKIPGGRSEKLAWSFYSQRNGEYITADMTKALRTIENQSSEIEELKRQVAELKGLIYEMKAPVKLIHTGKVK